MSVVGLFCCALLLGLAVPLSLPIAKGPFQPSMDSLKSYQCPEWFRDAKFGIWAHWGPQSVPMDGDWYARNLYEQGSGQYQDHLEHYGHPSKTGYKDIIPLWKAEKWDPDRLMRLYKKAGAKYFVSMGTHHDNFFLWNSKLHRWNAVQMGPHRDVVGDWQKAAKKYGLRFGVSEHLGASFTWFQASHGSDKTGPEVGVPYDGADSKNWDLYHQPALPGDTGWYSNDPRWQQEWFNDIRELVDNYHPDLLYSDGGVPFGNEVGMSMIAHFYNSNEAVHAGKMEAVYNCKQASGGRWVEDLERGIMAGVSEHPWQTDTSIGDWFYNRNWKYRPIDWVVHTLVDNVSKNGNLLLNVVQRPDGSIDPEVETMLHQLADWTAIHGEAIYGSRPWLVYGEGTVRARSGSFNEDYTYSAKDIRFTTKGPTLYALALGWPEDDRLLIRSLGNPPGDRINRISSVKLLGYKGVVQWSQSPDGLLVELPSTKVSDLTVGLRINGQGLTPTVQPVEVTTVAAGPDGGFELTPDAADLHGNGIREQTVDGKANLGYWDNPEDSAWWHLKVDAPGTYRITATLASISSGSWFVVAVGDQQVTGECPNTGDWNKFETVDLGQVQIKQAGPVTVKIRPRDPNQWKAMNVQGIALKPEK